MDLIVTGSRKFDSYGLMELSLLPILPQITRVIHGAAPGADALASRWAYENKINVSAYGAQWGKYGSAAGGIRNSKMLRMHPEALVYAFPLPGSKGTWDCIRKARKRGMKVVVVN